MHYSIRDNYVEKSDINVNTTCQLSGTRTQPVPNCECVKEIRDSLFPIASKKPNKLQNKESLITDHNNLCEQEIFSINIDNISCNTKIKLYA